VFVTGTRQNADNSSDYLTIAYDGATGGQQWASHYAGIGGDNDASAVAVSPDGNTVYDTGGSSDTSGDFDDATVAYNAATGAQQWASRFSGPLQFDGALPIAVRRDVVHSSSKAMPCAVPYIAPHR
jgi:outer membrane protein assembly factor BamB